jgi:hypothetical protein
MEGVAFFSTAAEFEFSNLKGHHPPGSISSRLAEYGHMFTRPFGKKESIKEQRFAFCALDSAGIGHRACKLSKHFCTAGGLAYPRPSIERKGKDTRNSNIGNVLITVYIAYILGNMI